MGSHHGTGIAKARQTKTPTASPAEVLKISPEALEVANSYLACQNIADVSRNLGLATDDISEILDRREVRAYIDNVFLDYGFNNRFKMRDLMDSIIQKKLQEMDEADIGSQKDIIEIMQFSHKMSMDILDKQIKLEQAKAANIKNQTNVQINNNDGSNSNYGLLMEKLLAQNTI